MLPLMRAQRSAAGEVAAEIDLDDVVDTDPTGDVEHARRDILGAVVDNMRCAAGTSAFGFFRAS
jgi:hypothetical protein